MAAPTSCRHGVEKQRQMTLQRPIFGMAETSLQLLLLRRQSMQTRAPAARSAMPVGEPATVAVQVAAAVVAMAAIVAMEAVAAMAAASAMAAAALASLASAMAPASLAAAIASAAVAAAGAAMGAAAARAARVLRSERAKVRLQLRPTRTHRYLRRRPRCRRRLLRHFRRKNCSPPFASNSRCHESRRWRRSHLQKVPEGSEDRTSKSQARWRQLNHRSCQLLLRR